MNQKRREDYALSLGRLQILPTVNSDDNTTRIYPGTIRVP